MQPRQLKRLIETGHYRLEPELVADAMLQRRGVRELLTGSLAASANGAAGANGSISAAGRTQSPSAIPRQAA